MASGLRLDGNNLTRELEWKIVAFTVFLALLALALVFKLHSLRPQVRFLRTNFHATYNHVLVISVYYSHYRLQTWLTDLHIIYE